MPGIPQGGPVRCSSTVLRLLPPPSHETFKLLRLPAALRLISPYLLTGSLTWLAAPPLWPISRQDCWILRIMDVAIFFFFFFAWAVPRWIHSERSRIKLEKMRWKRGEEVEGGYSLCVCCTELCPWTQLCEIWERIQQENGTGKERKERGAVVCSKKWKWWR